MPGLEHLEFLLDLDAKVDGAVKMLGVIDRSITALHTLESDTTKAKSALDKLDKTSEHATKTHDKHAHSALNLGHAFEGAKEHVHGLLEAMGILLVFEGLEKLTEKVLELGGEILHAAAGAERFQKSFALVLGQEGSEELLTWIEQISAHTEFTEARLKGVASSLVQVGLKGDALKRAVAGALDIAAMPGGSLEEAIGAMARLKRTGRAENRALAPLGLGENDFLAALSKRTGKPSEQLKKDLEKGKVDTMQSMEALFDLIHARTGKNLGAAGVEMSKTLGAEITHLKDIPELFFEALSKTEAFDRLKTKLGELLETIGPESEVGQRLANSLELVFTKAVDLVEHVDLAAWGTRIVDFMDKLPGRIETATEVLSAFGTVFKAAAGFVMDLGEELGRLAAVLYLAPGRLYDAAADLGKAVWQGIKDGITGGITSVMDAVGEMGDAMVGKLKGLLGIHSPSAVFEDLGKMSGAGYIQGLEGSMDGMKDSVPSGAFARPATGGVGMGSIQVVVNVNMGGGGGAGGEGAAELGQQVAQHVESILPGALQSAFQRMQQEAGS